MSNAHQRAHYSIIVRGFLLIMVLLLIGTTVYAVFEHLSLVDAFYLSGVTLSTLGYGDIAPKTVPGKVFTVVYALTGIGIVFYTLGKMFHIFFTHTLLDPVFHDRHEEYHKTLTRHKRKKVGKKPNKA